MGDWSQKENIRMKLLEDIITVMALTIALIIVFMSLWMLMGWLALRI